MNRSGRRKCQELHYARHIEARNLIKDESIAMGTEYFRTFFVRCNCMRSIRRLAIYEHHHWFVCAPCKALLWCHDLVHRDRTGLAFLRPQAAEGVATVYLGVVQKSVRIVDRHGIRNMA